MASIKWWDDICQGVFFFTKYTIQISIKYEMMTELMCGN